MSDKQKGISAAPPIDAALAQAVEQFMRPVTVPILVDRAGDVLDHLGTGTLFDVSGKIFLVTAKHIFEREDLTKIAIPEDPKGPKVHVLGHREVYAPKDSSQTEFDISVLRLDGETINNLVRANWNCLSMIDTASAGAEGQFVICGYPSALMEPRKKEDRVDLVGTLMTFYTNRIAVPPDALAPVDERVDMFFNHETEGRSITGQPLDSPKFKGVSGASVWQILPTAPGSFWTPQRALKVVGIQSSARHGNYLRAKSWDYVRETIRRAE